MHFFKRTVATLFAIDIRSLALMRICLGLLLLTDLISRSRTLVAHYTDQGILPRKVLLSDFSQSASWSINYAY